MSTRNVNQFMASVQKLAKDDLKFTGVVPIKENNGDVLVSDQHDDVVKIANMLRQMASKLLSSERTYADEEIVRQMSKDKKFIAAYAAKISHKETPVQPQPGRQEY